MEVTSALGFKILIRLPLILAQTHGRRLLDKVGCNREVGITIMCYGRDHGFINLGDKESAVRVYTLGKGQSSPL